MCDGNKVKYLPNENQTNNALNVDPDNVADDYTIISNSSRSIISSNEESDDKNKICTIIMFPNRYIYT